MDGEVLKFQRRDSTQYPGLTCSCGDAWFTVEAVVLATDGTVTGYSGTPKCRTCGTPQGPLSRGSAL